MYNTSNAYTFASRGEVPLCVTLAAVTITYEVGVQNLALAFAIAFNILQNPALAVTALIYAAVMPATALLFVRFARRLIESESAELS